MQLNLYNYILEKEGVEDEEPKRAYGFAKEVSDRSEWINKVRNLLMYDISMVYHSS